MMYFIAYLFLEVIVSVNISSSIGGIATFVEIMFSAFVGISILINFRKTLVKNISAVSYSCIDLKQFQRLNLFTLFGAILLIIPGFMTDIIGLLMQFGLFTGMIVNRYDVKFGKYDRNYEVKNITKDSDVIDVEIIASDATIR